MCVKATAAVVLFLLAISSAQFPGNSMLGVLANRVVSGTLGMGQVQVYGQGPMMVSGYAGRPIGYAGQQPMGYGGRPMGYGVRGQAMAPGTMGRPGMAVVGVVQSPALVNRPNVMSNPYSVRVK